MDYFLIGINNIDCVYGYVYISKSELEVGEIPTDIVNVILDFYCDEIKDGYSWFEIDNFRLEKGMSGCGYIMYKHFIITFGGYANGEGHIDKIYLLDIEDRNKGWKEILHIKCPAKGEYRAVLTSDNNIHLFRSTEMTGHFSIPLGSILAND